LVGAEELIARVGSSGRPLFRAGHTAYACARGEDMKFVLWLILLVLCWPIALLALLLWPIVWLLSLPFRLVGIAVEGVFELLRAIIFLPARILGGRPS